MVTSRGSTADSHRHKTTVNMWCIQSVRYRLGAFTDENPKKKKKKKKKSTLR
eukprot:TRINITY_DN1635_c0_g1_i1.p2 TRINITY_DN1635_c0_g1~~TRINITY_DN1635_c0_g1_i1.p2  ORF type:complete len:52 (+),score=21.02 TRINITY_DN1635_c0_g1_i1:359-514(+)